MINVTTPRATPPSQQPAQALPLQQPHHHPAPAADEARIAYLFRGARRQGRIHPLLHLVQQHRAEQQAAALRGTIE